MSYSFFGQDVARFMAEDLSLSSQCSERQYRQPMQPKSNLAAARASGVVRLSELVEWGRVGGTKSISLEVQLEGMIESI